MIPTMLVLGLLLGLVPRRLPRSLGVAVLLAVVVSLAFGLLVGEPVVSSLLALANTVIGLGLGRALQLVVPAPGARRSPVG